MLLGTLWTALEASNSVTLKQGHPAPFSGILYDLDNHNELLREYALMKADITYLEKKILRLQREIEDWDLRLRNEEIRTQIAKDSCPGLWERKVGICIGLGAAVDTQGEVDTAAAIVYGWRF